MSQTATNPTTGERLTLQNGQWVPLASGRVTQAPAARQAPRYQGALPTDVSAVFPSLVMQESGGRAGVRGPDTRYGNALGRTQLLPATAQEMAGRVGVPFRQDLLTGTSQEASDYQDRLGLEYLKQGYEQTGNMRDALRYYHGGPDRSIWGPKTDAYAEEVLGRYGGGQSAPAQAPAQQQYQTATNPETGEKKALVNGQWVPHRPDGIYPEIANATFAQDGASVGSSQSNPFVITKDTPRELLSGLMKGTWVATEDDGDGKFYVHRLASDAYQNLNGPEQDTVLPGGNLYLHTPDTADAVRAFTTAAGEQVPFLDEAAVATVAAFDPNRTYSQVRDNYRAMQAVDNQSNRGARVAGGLTGFAGSLALPISGAGFVGRGAGAADKIARAGLVGGATGAVSGAGNADGGLSERAQAAIAGGLLGYGTGAVLGGGALLAPRVSSGLSEAGATVKRGLGFAPAEAEITQRSTESATEYVRRLVQQAGADLEGNPTSLMGKPITSAEAIGPSGVSNMAALSRRAGRAGNMAQSQIGARAVEQPGRVVQDFADITGMDPAGSADMIQNLADAGRKRAAPLYEAAYNTPIRITDDVQEILDTPAGKQALRNAIDIARNDRIDPTSLGFDFDAAGDVVNIRQPSVRTLDYVKRGLDDVLDSYRDSTTRRLNLNNASRPIVGLVDDLRSALVRMTGGETGTYAQALAAGGEPIRLETAFSQAPRLFQSGTNLRSFRAGTARMGQAEREALVAGYADKLYADAQAGRLGTRQLGQINLPVTREKLADLVGAEKADDFLARVNAEAALSRSGARMAPGTNSVTAEALEAMRDQDQGVGILNDLARNIEGGNVIGGALKTGAEALAAPVAGFVRGFQSPASQPVRDEIARLLLMPPDDLAQILAQVRGGSSTQGEDLVSRLLNTGGVRGGRSGSEVSRPFSQSPTRPTRRAQQ